MSVTGLSTRGIPNSLTGLETVNASFSTKFVPYNGASTTVDLGLQNIRTAYSAVGPYDLVNLNLLSNGYLNKISLTNQTVASPIEFLNNCTFDLKSYFNLGIQLNASPSGNWNMESVYVDPNTTNLNFTSSGGATITFSGDYGWIKSSGWGPQRVMVTDSSSFLTASATTSTELSYLSGVTSSIQTQLNAKLNLSGSNASQNINIGAFKVQSSATPSLGTDYINKTYGDSTYAFASALANYLPLSGGTMTGDIIMNTRKIYYRGSDVEVTMATSGSNSFKIDSFNLAGTAYQDMEHWFKQLYFVGNPISFANRAANPSKAQLIIQNNTNSERLLLGNYYTGGAGSGCFIQSSDFYTDSGATQNTDHGTDLLINPLGGKVCVGPATNSFLDPVSRFTVNTSYFDDEAGGICINASDSSTVFYRLHLFPYVQSGGNVAYRFRTINQGTAYDSFTVFSTGNVGFLKEVRIAGSNVLHFGYDQTKEANAGKIGYQVFGTLTNLDIVGAGSGTPRKVRIYDKLGVARDADTYTFEVGGTSRFTDSMYIDGTGGGNYLTFSNSNYSVEQYINLRFLHSTRSAYIQSYLPGSNKCWLRFFPSNSDGGNPVALEVRDDLVVVWTNFYLGTNPVTTTKPAYSDIQRLMFRDADGYVREGTCATWMKWNYGAWTSGYRINNAFYKGLGSVILLNITATWWTTSGGNKDFNIYVYAPGTWLLVTAYSVTKYFNITGNHETITVPLMLDYNGVGYYDLYVFAAGAGITSDINDFIWFSALTIG